MCAILPGGGWDDRVVPDEQSALKVLYLTTIRRETNRPNPTGQINGWNTIFNVFAMTYGDRLGLN